MEEKKRLVLVEELFHAALALDPSLRTAFLDSSCASDRNLRSEVQNLISMHEKPGDFLNSPAYEGGLLGEPQASSLTGKSLGHYEILDCIGTGGMGKVYRARDTHLDRSVAIKVLHSEAVANRERKRRFVQEAKSASALNHPGIVTIHDISQSEGVDFIAMEYITGKTLNQLIRRKGLPFGEVLKYAVQIADALAAAHTAGIVHRDLKPANIMVTEKGLVKVLDFGLAKLTEPAPVDESGTTQTLEPVTEEGTILGTVAYMSPEQARGEELDARTDLFSFGVVLYEMATGQQAFTGSTSAVVFTAILTKAPISPVRLNPEVPDELERIINKALEKDRDFRFQSASEMRVDLQRLMRDSDSGCVAVTITPETATKARSFRRLVGRRILIVVAALVLVTALGTLLYRRLMPPPPRPFESMEMTRLTDSGKASMAAISPDGKYVVHAVTDNGKSSLWLRHVVTGSNVQILPPAEGNFNDVTFSRDGNSLYYVFNTGKPRQSLCKMPVLGGNSRKLIESPDGTTSGHLSPDEKRLILTRSKGGESVLLTVNIDGSGERQLATRNFPELIRGASLSPDGKTLSCSIVSFSGGFSMGLEAIPAESGPARRFGSRTWFDLSPGVWLPNSRGIINHACERSGTSQIWYISYPEGDVRRITNDLNSYSSLSLNMDASALVAVQGETIAQIWVVPVGDPTRARQISKGRQDGVSGLVWTSDDNIIFGAPDGRQNPQLWIMATDSTPPRQLTAEGRLTATPAVCGDKRHLVYLSYLAGTPHIWRSNPDGSDARQLTNGAGEFQPSCSPDGAWLTYGTSDPKGVGIWRMPIDGGNPIRIWERYGSGQISPDGKWVLIRELMSGFQKPMIIPATGGQPVKTFDMDPELGLPQGWTADSRALLYAKTSSGVWNIWQRSLDGGKAKQLTKFKNDQFPQLGGVAMSRDGKKLAVVRAYTTTDVVLIKDLNAR